MSPILVATDLSARSDRAVLRAAHLAERTGMPLHIVHVVDDDLPAAMLHQQSEAAETTLREMVAATPALKSIPVEIDVEVGHLAQLIPVLARERQAGLIVLGTHRGRGMADLIAAPTLEQLLRGLDMPVLVAVGRPEVAYDRVTLGWDFSDAEVAPLDFLAKIAPGAELTLLHAWQAPYMGAPYAFDTGAITGVEAELRDETAARLAEAADAVRWDGAVRHELGQGTAANVLTRSAADGQADLICIGRHGRSGLARFFLGETALAVALRADCDVLIAPPSGASG